MKEINILCVEDGSVDVERLEQGGLHDGKVIIYRQGANPPFVLKLKTDAVELDALRAENIMLEQELNKAINEIVDLKSKLAKKQKRGGTTNGSKEN